MVFPQISYIIIYSFSNNYVTWIYAWLPLAVSQPNFNIPALVWQNSRYLGIDYITMNTNCQNDFMGTFNNYYGSVSIGNGNQ